MITIALEQPLVELGGRVRGTATWQNDGSPSESATIRLFWWTEGRGERAEETVAGLTVPTPGDLGQTGPVPFDLPVPLNEVVSYNGRLIQTRWAVEVRLGPKRRDPVELAEVLVAPVGAAEHWRQSWG